MLFSVRNREGAIRHTESFADWLRLFALTSAAGKPESIPLPSCLPRYWPEETD